MMMVFEGGEVYWAEFWNVFAYSSTHISAMIKWMVSLDSVYQIGPVSIPHDLFNSSGDDLWGGWSKLGGILKIGILSCFHMQSHNQ